MTAMYLRNIGEMNIARKKLNDANYPATLADVKQNRYVVHLVAEWAGDVAEQAKLRDMIATAVRVARMCK